MSDLILPRIAVASVWIYQGFWCKILGQAPHHQKILETTPFVPSSWARQALLTLGVLECILGFWVLSGIRARDGAAVQTVLLVSLNATALVRARNMIPDPVGMLLQNCVLLILAWIAAVPASCYAAR